MKDDSGGGAAAGAHGGAKLMRAPANGLSVAGCPVELQLIPISACTLRVSLVPIADDGKSLPVEKSAELIVESTNAAIAEIRSLSAPRAIGWGDHLVRVAPDPLTISVADKSGQTHQAVQIDDAGNVSFAYGAGPIFGLGQGGCQYDRRGGFFPLVNGQGEGVSSLDMRLPGAKAPEYEFDLAVEGARITIPWIVSADGWAILFHRPGGVFDLTDDKGRLTPASEGGTLLDAFFVVAPEPAQIMREYAALTGYPHLPPLWSLGYLQSHRTLLGREEILAEAKEFRRRKLPCDGFIYLGTGFTPDGWNTGHGAFEFNHRVFPDPDLMIRQLHSDHFRIALHVVDPPLHLSGTVHDRGAIAEKTDNAAHYWKEHRPVSRLGVDGWWPDVGDRLDPAARLARIRMYWDGPIMDHPNTRPFALHRNGYAGIQRYGWLWSGDIDSTWQTLATQVPVGINCGLTGIPYWGTDTGGFITTPELTGELFVRWFQYSAFCPSFRAHGRTWKLRLPWGWNTGEFGPEEYDGRRVVPGQLPDPKELRNAEVEPICKTYLELRYSLLPYLYSAVRETHETGMPVIRALWLHYPEDPAAATRGHEYLWGRDILVAPVVEKGAASRTLYLPKGIWHDFWTGAAVAGGREIVRPVDLKTMPLYVRAGAIIPTTPVKQSTAEGWNGLLVLTVYPGSDGAATVYEDDGASFDYEKGAYRKIRFGWDESARRFSLALQPGSMPLESTRPIVIKIAGTDENKSLMFDGREQTIQF
jgi:alpha-glucosidase/alpha-D-xyloside xylohydrolase